MNTPEELLDEFRRNPDSIGETFNNPLSFKEEFLLNGLENDLRERVHALLDLALAGDADIDLSEAQRREVMELTRIQKSIFNLLRERGSISHGRTCAN
jgi:hypothetical protein